MASLTALVDGGTLRLIKTVIRNQSVLIVKSAFAEADQQAIVELAHRKLANPVAPSAGEGVTVRPPTPE